MSIAPKLDYRVLSLRVAGKEDIPQLLKWSVTEDFLFYFGSLIPGTLAAQKEEWIRRITLNQIAFGPRQTLMITNTHLEAIGFITLADVDWRNRHCAFEIYVDKKHRSESMGFIAASLAFRYVFEQLGLIKIYSYVMSENTSAIAIQESIQHKPEAVFQKQYALNGKYFDVSLFGYYREEISKIISDREIS